MRQSGEFGFFAKVTGAFMLLVGGFVLLVRWWM